MGGQSLLRTKRNFLSYGVSIAKMKDGKIHIGTIYHQVESGAAIYRLLMPNQWLANKYPDEFLISNFRDGQIPILDNEFLQSIDIFLISRQVAIGDDDLIHGAFNTLRAYGAKVVLDYDDFWVLPSDHHLYGLYKHEKIPERLTKNVALSDHIFCTTSILRDRLFPINPNVTIVANAPYPDGISSFKPAHEESDKVRFGFFGGAQHIPDVNLMAESMSMLRKDKSLNGKYTIICAGFSENDAYMSYEKVFTDNYRNPNYARIPALSVFEFAAGYNHADISYAPLRGDRFNHFRSELKCVEAGYMGKGLICSKMPQYEPVIKHGWNGFMVGEKETGAWYRYTRDLILDKDMRTEMTKNLRDTIMKMFDYEDIFPKRADLYRNLVKKS